MKRINFIIILVILLYNSEIKANNLGVGIMIGEPVGINFTSKISGEKYLNILAGWPGGNFYINGDINLKNNLEPKGLLWYWGGGLFFDTTKEKVGKGETETKSNFGIRIPFGLEYITDIKLAFLAEIVPSLKILPETDFIFMGGIGIRYYFK